MKPGKKTLTGLLVAACILSGIFLAATPKPSYKSVKTEAQLDSLLTTALWEANIPRKAVRTRVIEMDSSFSRKEFRVEVPSGFSKTSFHLQLHHTLMEVDLDCPARLVFPERDMFIYVVNKGTVFRTIRLITADPQPE